jgi:hypothetical protein
MTCRSLEARKARRAPTKRGRRLSELSKAGPTMSTVPTVYICGAAFWQGVSTRTGSAPCAATALARAPAHRFAAHCDHVVVLLSFAQLSSTL